MVDGVLYATLLDGSSGSPLSLDARNWSLSEIDPTTKL